MLRRDRAPDEPVTVYLDGSPVTAARGEPLAIALLAAGHLTLGRSPKLHRPRAPTCLRGACDGCLARVDGVPNVMTCLRPAQGGERIAAQNVVGSRKADLLRVTDWFFPHGIDHHHFMAGVPGVQDVMQSFARKLSGLGRLPSQALPPRAARPIEGKPDVLVIGAGPAGVAVASRLARSGAREGLRVVLVDDGLAAGSLAADPDLAAAFRGRSPLDGIALLSPCSAIGIYEGDVLLAGTALAAPDPNDTGESPRGAVVAAALARPRAIVVATGAHDPVLAVPNNDLPGVFSARALCRLVAAGIRPEGRVAIVGGGPWAERLAGALGEAQALRVAPGDVVAVRGTGHVRGIDVRVDGAVRTRKVVAVAVAGPGAPSFELAAQAGASVRFEPEAGYAIEHDEHGRAAERVWVIGECTGAPLDPAVFERAAERVATDVLAAIGPKP